MFDQVMAGGKRNGGCFWATVYVRFGSVAEGGVDVA